MEDGLYIAGVWASGAEEFMASYQGNDITKTDTLQASYTSELKLPDSLAVKRITQGSENPGSGSNKPYQSIPSFVVQSNETVFSGLLRFKNFNKGWSVLLVEPKKVLFERINRSIRTIDLTGLNFKWDVNTMSKAAKATDGVIFPLVDYGIIQDDQQPNDLLLPAVYVRTIVDKLLAEEGLRVTGLEDNREYKQSVLPFAEEKAIAHTDEWVNQRQARITVTPAAPLQINFKGNIIFAKLPLNIDNKPLQGFTQGSEKPFDVVSNEYICPEKMRLNVDFSMSFKIKVGIGSVAHILYIRKNGQNVKEERRNYTAPNDISFARKDFMSISGVVDCEKGDRVTIGLYVSDYTAAVSFYYEAYFDESMFVVFAPDPSVYFGDYFPVAPNLPDITGLDLIKSIAFMYSGNWLVDEQGGEFRFQPFTKTVQSRSFAPDWTSKVDQITEGDLTTSISPYGIKNLLKWKEVDDVVKGYADGLIDGVAGDLEVTLFELPFSACVVSQNRVSAVDRLPFVPLRTPSASGGEPGAKSTTPRILLAHSSLTTDIKTTIANASGETESVTVPVRVSWFDKPPTIVPSSDWLSLSFDKLIPKYFSGLTSILQAPKTLEVGMYLTSNDIANLDFNTLVRISDTRAGTLVLSDCFYYVNKIVNWKNGKVVMVTLIVV